MGKSNVVLRIDLGARERHFFASSRQNWGGTQPEEERGEKREKARADTAEHRPQSESDRRESERERERERHREVSGSTPAGREKIDKASQRARPASVGYRQTNGASVRFPFIALQVLVNAILIFGVYERSR